MVEDGHRKGGRDRRREAVAARGGRGEDEAGPLKNYSSRLKWNPSPMRMMTTALRPQNLRARTPR